MERRDREGDKPSIMFDQVTHITVSLARRPTTKHSNTARWLNGPPTNRHRLVFLVMTAIALSLGIAVGLLEGDKAIVFAQEIIPPPVITSVAITSTGGGEAVVTPPGEYWHNENKYCLNGSSRSRWPKGIYGIGDTIEVTATFDRPVVVSGIPGIYIQIVEPGVEDHHGNALRLAEYAATDGAQVTFAYTVAEGDEDANGVSIDADGLALREGSITDDEGLAATITHDALSHQEDHRVDGIRPRVAGVSILSASRQYQEAYTLGDEVIVSVSWSEQTVFSTNTYPQLKLDIGGETRIAEHPCYRYENWWFPYHIQPGDFDEDGLQVIANSMQIPDGWIRDEAGNDADLTHASTAASYWRRVDAAGPTVTSIAITSAPGDDDTYDTGDKIEVAVTFSEDVTVPNVGRPGVDGIYRTHRPHLELDIGGAARVAQYQSNDGTDVVFAYTVQAGDSDQNGIAISANKLYLDGGYIVDAFGNNPIPTALRRPPVDAVVSHDAVADDAGHKVAGSSSPLTLSGPTTVEFKENTKFRDKLMTHAAYYSLPGTDAAVTWSLSGDDSDDFSIRETLHRIRSGYLNFQSPPNYEDPQDADADNEYRVTIEVSDGTNTRSLQVVVVVLNAWLDSDEVPVITGTPRVGETLTADLSGITQSDQYSFKYVWVMSDGTTDTNITGSDEADNPTYTLTANEVDNRIKVRVFFLDYPTGSRDILWLTSEGVGPVVPEGQALNTPAVGAPAIGGTAQVGHTLTVDTSGIADADGLTNISYRYQWLFGSSTEIAGATSSTYELQPSDATKRIQVRVNFTDDAGHWESLTSAETDPVAEADPVAEVVNSQATGVPVISGTAQVGHTLTVDTSGIADADGLTRVSYRYQWLFDGGTEISGATNSTYELQPSDANQRIRVRVSFTDDAGYEESLTSVEVGPVNSRATGAPVIIGTAQVGQTLTVDTSGIADANGLTNVSYSYGWQSDRGGEIYFVSDPTRFELRPSDVNKRFQVQVTFTDDAGHREWLVSEETDPVTEPQDPEGEDLAPLLPTAKAGPDLTGAPGESVTLQGKGSTNPYGRWHQMEHQWTQLSGPAVTLTHPRKTQPASKFGDPRLTIPADAADGTPLEFQLTVTDQEGESDSDTMTVTVTGAEPEQPPEPENTPPTASIDAAQVVTARTGETVRLQGAGNDAKTASRHLTFAWSQVRGTPRISMTGADTATASFTIPDVTRRKDLTFRLTVTDEGGLSADAEITVTLIPPPTTPEITIELMHSNFRVVREGRTAEFEILATDTTWEGLPLTLEIAIDGDFGVTTGRRTVMLEVGYTEIDLAIATEDDDVGEANGLLTVTVVKGPGYTVGSPASAEITISDDDGGLPLTGVSLDGIPLEFTPDRTEYLVQVAHEVAQTAVRSAEGAVLQIAANGGRAEVGETIPLKVGGNVINIARSSAGSTERIYTVTITRAAPTSPDAEPSANEWSIHLDPASGVRPANGQTAVDVRVTVRCNGSSLMTEANCPFEPGSVTFQIQADGSEPGEATHRTDFGGPRKPFVVQQGPQNYVVRLNLRPGSGDAEYVPFVLMVNGEQVAEARFQITP